jgi:hypothetical protein
MNEWIKANCTDNNNSLVLGRSASDRSPYPPRLTDDDDQRKRSLGLESKPKDTDYMTRHVSIKVSG